MTTPRLLVPAALVVIVLSIGALFLLTATSAIGPDDCIAQAADGGVEVVDCDAGAAAYRVVGVLDDVRNEQSQPACMAAFPETTASYFDGEVGTQPGRVLCLVVA